MSFGMIDCFAPRNSFWIDPQDNVRPCARFKQKLEHITEFDSFSDVTTSESFQLIQTDHNNSVWPAGCIRCKQDEEQNLKSKRKFYSDVGLKSPDDFMIDISMGNYCNLKCRMCGPNNSTMWHNDFKFLTENNLFKDPGLDFSAYQLSEKDIEKLITHIESVKGEVYIELKGGEPLIMPQTKHLVDRIVNLKNSNKITLLIVTNASVVPNWVELLNSKIKKLELVVSVDGVGDVFDYIRGNNKFNYNVCKDNIEYYSKLSNIDLKFNVVVQNLNIHQMLEVHNFLKIFNTTVNYITLSMPAFLAPNVMPEEAKKSIYSDFIKNSMQFDHYEGIMQNIHKTLLEETDPELYKQFKDITLALDSRRNQTVLGVAPHLIK
jgi:MoaA/NifB/PqqE/SkfB family radical SAM enzyme